MTRGNTPGGRIGLVAGYFVAIAGGVIAGLIARSLAATLPRDWATLANTSALWGLVPVAVVLALGHRGARAMVSGILALGAMVAVWIALAPTPPSTRELGLWIIVGIAAGAVCGLAASCIRGDRPGIRRIVAGALIAGLVAGEGLYGILLIGGPQWITEIVLGVILAVVFGRTISGRALTLATTAVVAAALVGAYFLYDAIAVL